jgi:hypothetical protein
VVVALVRMVCMVRAFVTCKAGVSFRSCRQGKGVAALKEARKGD